MLRLTLIPVFFILPMAIQADTLPAGVSAFLTKHCVECHGPASQKGDLRLDQLPLDFDKAEAREKWKAVFERVSEGTMPPAKKPQPSKAESAALTDWVQGKLVVLERQRQKTEGRVVLRRLNRIEFENTLRDLLGVSVDVKDLLPADPISHGFDNLGKTLSVSEVHLKRYLEAADVALKAAIARNPKPSPATKTYTFAEGRSANNIGKHWLKREDGAVVFFTSGTFPSTQLDSFRAPADGRYQIEVRGYAYQSKRNIPFAFYHGNFGRGGDVQLQGYHEFPPDKPTTIRVTVDMERGDSIQTLPQEIRGFNAYNKGNPDLPETYQGAGLAILSVTVVGPFVDEWPSRGHKLLFGDLPLQTKPAFKGKFPPKTGPSLDVVSANPEADAKRLLPGFLSAAFRRPVPPEKVEPYLKLFASERENGADFQAAMTSVAIAAFCSPDFLYLRETAGRLDDYALATRLSYFLSRSMPDDELLKVASQENLTRPEVLRQQTERLLKHDHAKRLSADFTDAWLDLRNIDFTTPDKILYPEFDGMLHDAMVKETRSFFDEVLTNNLSAKTFLASDFAMLNHRLAKHYGIPGVDGLGIRKVNLPEKSVRGGLLTQASVLRVSANGTNTSPVVRGVYVLERFMGTKPPTPPPGVPAVEPDIRGTKTVREILEKHRSVETCTGCHRLIDPPGFALEEFDVIGGWRDRFRILSTQGPAPVPGARYRPGPKVDAAGEMTDGSRFQNFEEFRKLLLADSDRFVKCLAEKLVTFATGREIGLADHEEIARLVRESSKRDHAFRELLHAVVQSELFRTK